MLFLASPLASYATPIPIPTLSLSLTLTPYLGGVLFLASPLSELRHAYPYPYPIPTPNPNPLLRRRALPSEPSSELRHRPHTRGHGRHGHLIRPVYRPAPPCSSDTPLGTCNHVRM